MTEEFSFASNPSVFKNRFTVPLIYLAEEQYFAEVSILHEDYEWRYHVNVRSHTEEDVAALVRKVKYDIGSTSEVDYLYLGNYCLFAESDLLFVKNDKVSVMVDPSYDRISIKTKKIEASFDASKNLVELLPYCVNVARRGGFSLLLEVEF